jgi:hypothetical protein
VGVSEASLDEHGGSSRVVALDNCVGALYQRQNAHHKNKLHVVDTNKKTPAVHKKIQVQFEVATKRNTPDENAQQTGNLTDLQTTHCELMKVEKPQKKSRALTSSSKDMASIESCSALPASKAV